MVKNSCLVAVLGAAAALAFWFARTGEQNAPTTSAAVVEILAQPQSYDGQHIDDLAALGSEAIPAIAGQLLSDPFPLRLVFALERIGDQAGAEPLLEYAQTREPLSDSNKSAVTALAIKAAARLGSSNEADKLLRFLTTDVHPQVRLAAAQAICTVLPSGHSGRQAAEDLVFYFYENRASYLQDISEGISSSELIDALIAVDTDATRDFLLEYEIGTHHFSEVVSYLSIQKTPRFQETLAKWMHEGSELADQLLIAEALVAADSNQISQQFARSLLSRATAHGYSQDTVARAQHVVERVTSTGGKKARN